MPKIITYNVNGIRAAITKNFIEWLKAANPDILLLQETKIQQGQIDESIFTYLGYQCFWHYAEKKGYSGVAILTKIEPKNVAIGTGIGHIDAEGRVIRADFEDFSVMSVYIPSGSSGDERQDYKMLWLADFQAYINNLKTKIQPLLIGGDFNICHKAIDIHNPISNANSSGFLPEEREWLKQFIQSGFIDIFRYFRPEPHQYTWWSYRAGARGKNLGWRIDYIMADKSMASRLKKAEILNEAMHSDHCPVLTEFQ
jgi:exodeoxyribonuclease-3